MVPVGPSNPEWMEISIHADPVTHEALCAVLFRLGCTGVVTDNCGDGIVKAYFPPPANPEKARETISSSIRELGDSFPHIPPPLVLFGSIQGQDWGRNWRRFFRAERVTPSLTIVPAWEPVPQDTGGTAIRMDPGPAFGTGKHPSTRLCLRAIELAAKPRSWDLLDVGTGSGILAIYGAMLGAERIRAIDIDEDALHWAEKNLHLNHLEGKVACSSRPLAELKEDFFMVTANLLLNTILDLISHLSRMVKPGGCLILSGLLGSQVDLVSPLLQERGFIREKTLFQEDWACLLARKPG